MPEDKKQLVQEIIRHIGDIIDNKVADATRDGYDSYAGIGSWQAESKLEKTLYKLFDIPFEEDEDHG